MTIKDIYCYVKDDKKNEGRSLQLKNKKFIDEIMKYIDQKGENITNFQDNMRSNF